MKKSNRDPNLVSVVIPCYNHGEYLQESIDSILNQTFQNFEVLVVDDGSDDPETIEILQQIDIPRVTVLHKENGHLSSARNYGIERSRGDLILTLDSDDIFDRIFLERAVEILRREPEVGVVTCYFAYFGSERKRAFRPQGGGVRDFLVGNNSCGNALFRYQCWVDAGGYNTALRGLEDWDFWIGVTKNGWRVHSIPEFLFHYRDTPGSMLKSIEQKTPELSRQIVEHHIDVYREHVAEVVCEKSREILDLKNRVRAMKEENKKLLRNRIRRSVSNSLRWLKGGSRRGPIQAESL